MSIRRPTLPTEPDNVPIPHILNAFLCQLLLFSLFRILWPAPFEPPLVVFVEMMVARHLLLARPVSAGILFGIRLHMGMQQTSPRCKRMQGDFGTVGNGPWLLRDEPAVAFQIGLEKRVHLRVTRAGFVENRKVDVKNEGVDREREDDEEGDSGDPVANVGPLKRSYRVKRCRS